MPISFFLDPSLFRSFAVLRPLSICPVFISWISGSRISCSISRTTRDIMFNVRASYRTIRCPCIMVRRGKTFGYLFVPTAYLTENRLPTMDTNHMYVFLHTNCLSFLSGFDQSRRYWQSLVKMVNRNFHENCVCSEWCCCTICRQMGVQHDEVRVGLWNCSAKAPKSDKSTHLKVRHCFD